MHKERENPETKDVDLSSIREQLTAHIEQKGGSAAVGGPDFVKELTKMTLEALLEAEINEHLGYKKHDPVGHGSGNSRNGRNSKKVRADIGEIEISVPRDRNSSFEPQAVKKRDKNVSGFADKIVSLYARGLTTREISEHLAEMYDIEVSHAFISQATEEVRAKVEEWQNRPLEPIYPILYMDCIRCKIRDEELGRVLNKAVYLALGITLEGVYEVLGLWIERNEGAAFWMSILSDLKARGVENILIACVDGLTGFPEAIEASYPQADIQLCVVHQIRNTIKFVPWKDRKALCRDLKPVYTAPTIAAAETAMDAFEAAWGKKYPTAVASWRRNWDKLTTFYGYPVELRTMIYTTNTIEALNRQLRKNSKNRGVFPDDMSLKKLLYLNIENLRKKWRPRKGWSLILNQLSVLFPDKISSSWI